MPWSIIAGNSAKEWPGKRRKAEEHVGLSATKCALVLCTRHSSFYPRLGTRPRPLAQRTRTRSTQAEPASQRPAANRRPTDAPHVSPAGLFQGQGRPAPALGATINGLERALGLGTRWHRRRLTAALVAASHLASTQSNPTAAHDVERPADAGGARGRSIHEAGFHRCGRGGRVRSWGRVFMPPSAACGEASMPAAPQACRLSLRLLSPALKGAPALPGPQGAGPRRVPRSETELGHGCSRGSAAASRSCPHRRRRRRRRPPLLLLQASSLRLQPPRRATCPRTTWTRCPSRSSRRVADKVVERGCSWAPA